MSEFYAVAGAGAPVKATREPAVGRLAEYVSEVRVPSQVVESISELPMYADGKLC
jgi:hypothetical protein